MFYLCESEASATTKAAHRTPPGSSALRESEASAANVLYARKRSVSGKCFICAKAKRQQQQKRLIGRPQEALLCAKAKRQRQMFYMRESEASAANVLSVRKRSVSNNKSGSSDAPRKLCSARKRSVSGKCFICAKAKRQRQMFYLCESEASATKRSVGTEINHTFCQRAKLNLTMTFLQHSLDHFIFI